MSNRRNSIRMESYKDEEKILKYKTQYQKNVKAARKLKVKIVSAKAKKGKKAVLKWKKIKNRATGKTAIVYGKWSGTKSLKARK